METRRTILVIDDASMFRELGALFLARTGRVITAASGPEGLELARSERPDVVLLDLLMPGMDGERVCREMKADPELCKLPVIVLTSSENPNDRARAIRAGADDVLSKPINRVTLIAAVNRFLRSAAVRGLPRIGLEAPVRLLLGRGEAWGTMRNLSRGGVFVEAERMMPVDSEIQLYFRLPETINPFAPTARVIWCRPRPGESELTGMGLRFLGMDRGSAQRLEDYVYERVSVNGAVA